MPTLDAVKRKAVIGDATLYLGDCLEILPTLGKVDAVITDPPYGIGEAAGKNKKRDGYGLAPARDYGNSAWDDRPADPAVIQMMRDCSDWQAIFGGNFYSLPPTSCWLVWDKENGASDFADCELAWTNFPKAVRRIRYMWNGMLRANGEARGDHPTQKPIGVMKWAIEHAPAARTVLDPFMGSGTTGVACMNLGRKFIGIEIEPKYFEIAVERLTNAQRQIRLFDEPKAKPEQHGMFP